MDPSIEDPTLPPSPFGILWNAPGTKSYFVGVDRGVLYLNDKAYAWTGLVSVDEKPSGGQIRPFYLDGVRRRNDHSLEEFEASISAYTYPAEFSECMGEVRLVPGLYLGQQPREPFALCYRNFVGNDIEGPEAAYQINVVYDAMANPVSRKHETLTKDSTPTPLTWDVETLPIDVYDHSPSARIRIDSREVSPEILRQVEEILYGTPDIPPRLPTVDELIDILDPIDDEIDDEEIPWNPSTTP